VTTSAERKALNEGVFREANERLERGAQELIGAAEGSVIPFLCECPRMDCTNVVLMTLAAYEDVRSGPRRGLAVVGHEDLEVEDVVARFDGYVVTEKFGRAGEVHEEADPRS
jgi:hypothetical protein